MQQAKVDVVIWREGDAFVSQCLNVDIASYGETVEEAAGSLKEAVELYFEDVPETEVSKMLSAVQTDISLPSKDAIKRRIHLDINN